MPRHPLPDRCQFCRRRKKKCDGQTSCHACKKANIKCIYTIPLSNSANAVGQVTKKRCLKSNREKPKMSTDPIRLNNGTRNRAEEETPGAVLNNQTRLAAKGATQLQTNDDGNIGAIDPEYPLPSIESSTPHRSFSVSDVDDMSDSSASTRATRYTSARMDWHQARVLLVLDKVLQWDCAAFCLINRDQFKLDLQTGSTNYCSPALVDALLALSAVVFRHDATNTVGNRERTNPSWDVLSSTLANAATQALHRGTGLPEAIPDIQALGVLALYCACNLWKEESWKFAIDFQEAIRNYCLQNAESDSALTSARRITASTYCGATSMNRVLIQIDEFNVNLPVHLQELSASNTKFNDGRICDRQSWTESLQLPTLTNEQFIDGPSLRGDDVYVVAAELYQLIEQVFKTCCVPDKDRSFAAAAATYIKGLKWYQSFFKYSEAYGGHKPLILFVHTYYHFCILTLFTPYVTNGTLFLHGSPPKKICEEAASNILRLMKHHDSLANEAEPVGLMNSFKNAALAFLTFYNEMQ